MTKATGYCNDCAVVVGPRKLYCEDCRADHHNASHANPIKTFNAQYAHYFRQAICPVCDQHMTVCTCLDYFKPQPTLLEHPC